jgi:hypothetical protein
VQSQGSTPSVAKVLSDNDVDADADAGATAPAPSAKKVSADTDVDTDTDADDVDKVLAKPDNASEAAPKVTPSFDASVKDAADGLGKLAKDVSDNVQKTLNALSGADKPAEKASESGTDKPSDNSTG